ncbi:helix-turn-helix domain-containing protein [Streptomyces sp. NPDC055078]
MGLPAHGRRRVPGLRREEVALLAGVSSDYYMRLEQGRESNPSAQVLGAVAAALRLDDDATGHLRRLSGLAAESRGGAGPAGDTDRVGAQLLRLLGTWSGTPAFVLGPALDVLAAKPLARALHSGFERFDNLARMAFLDPAGRDFYREWESAAGSCVAELRAAYGHDPGSPRIAEVARTLTARSPEFSELWARHEVRGKTGRTKHLRHPRAGDLHIRYTAFTVNESPRQQLIVYQAEPASGPSEAVLAALRTQDSLVGPGAE